MQVDVARLLTTRKAISKSISIGSKLPARDFAQGRGPRVRKGAVCDNPPVRQDHLDAVVWGELVRLLEDPSVIPEELNRRVEAARKAIRLKQREELLHREQPGCRRAWTAC